MPSLITKNGVRRYRASVPVPGDPKKRKQKLFPDSSKKSQKKAIIWEEETKTRLKEEIDTTCLTAIDWAERYLDDAKRRFVKKTYDEKRSGFKRLFNFHEVEPECRIDQFDITLADSFISFQNDNRSGNAANKDRKNLACAWDWGSKKIPEFPRDIINPFRSVEKMGETRFPRYIPSENDFWKVYEKAEGQDQIMLLASLHLATRRNELFSLKKSDIDFSNGTVTLWTRKRKGGNLESDTLPMTEELKKSLLEWCKIRLSHMTVDKKHIFVCLDKYPFCERYFGKPFKNRQHFMKKICVRAGVKPFGFHAIKGC